MAADVVVYTRPGCMFCQQVEELLQEADVPYRSKEIAERDKQDELCHLYGALSFPLVIADGVYAGGFTHVVYLHAQGKLPTIAGFDPDRQGASSEKGSPRPGSLEGYAALGKLLNKRDNES